MKIFFTSDPHYGHRNVIWLCKRPFASVEEMHEALIARWNSVVGPDDVVYVLGDVFFFGAKRSEEILARLNGKKILIRGNHDKHSLTKYKSWFAEVHSHLELKIAGRKVQVSHYPYAPTRWQTLKYRLKNFWKFWRKKKYMDLRYMDRRPKNLGGWLLHGHVHTAWRIRDRMINVGVDVWDFTPVSFAAIERIINDSDKI